MDKEQIFKDSITNNLNEVLENLGYARTLEQKGLVEFRNTNNNLVFVFEWNQTQHFYCQLRFAGEHLDYPIQIVIRSLRGLNGPEFAEFETEFSKRLNNWTKSLRVEISELKIYDLTINSNIIQDLKKKFEQQIYEYNKNIELEQIKQRADEAWNSQDFKQFITLMNDRVASFPYSYLKKLSIAKKKK